MDTDLLENYHAGISLPQKGEIILEFDRNNQNSQPSELNDASMSFICSISDSAMAKSENTDLISYHPPYAQNLHLLLAELIVHVPSRFK